MVFNRHEGNVRVGMHFDIDDWVDEPERFVGAMRLNNGVCPVG